MTTSSSPQTLQVMIRDAQYVLRGAPGQDDPLPATIDGMTMGEDNWISVICGTQWGPVQVTFAALTGPNDSTSAQFGAESVGERDLQCENGLFTVTETYADSSLETVTAGSALIRVRVSARGREEAFEASDVEGDPIEQHLIEYWPVDEQQDPVMILGPDNVGRSYLG